MIVSWGVDEIHDWEFVHVLLVARWCDLHELYSSSLEPLVDD